MKELNIPGKIPKQIRKWTCHKLECLNDYIEDYAQTLRNTDCCYLELYAGCGSCICKGTDCRIDDSEIRVLKTKTKFSKYIFIVRDNQDAENLKWLTAPPVGHNVEVMVGNCNSKEMLRQLFDLIPHSSSSLALIDPTGYKSMRWSTIETLAKHGVDWKGNKIELLIIFPLEMALLRNLSRPECHKSITRLYGNRQWQQIKSQKLEGKAKLDEVRHSLVELFKSGLKSLGYRYVDDFRPPDFPQKSYYHLIQASDRGSHAKTLKYAWGRTRYLPCELLYKGID